MRHSRREFLGGAIAVLASAAPPVLAVERPRRIGILHAGPEGMSQPRVDEFLREMRSLGYEVGRDLVVEVRLSGIDAARLVPLARELVGRGVELIVTEGTPATGAAQAATRTVPILTGVHDPVSAGFTRTLARPSGNVIGLSWGAGESVDKHFALLRSLVPGATAISMLFDSSRKEIKGGDPALDLAARNAGFESRTIGCGSEAELERAMRSRGRSVQCGLLLGYFTFIFYDGLAALAIRHRMAISGPASGWPDAGGLVGYGSEHRHPERRKAAMADKILRGVAPADIPFELPDRSEIVVNRKTAAALGLRIPPDVAIQATRVVG